jgi:hypothetical protein
MSFGQQLAQWNVNLFLQCLVDLRGILTTCDFKPVETL